MSVVFSESPLTGVILEGHREIRWENGAVWTKVSEYYTRDECSCRTTLETSVKYERKNPCDDYCLLKASWGIDDDLDVEEMLTPRGDIVKVIYSSVHSLGVWFCQFTRFECSFVSSLVSSVVLSVHSFRV